MTTELIRHHLKLSDAEYIVLDWKLQCWFRHIFQYSFCQVRLVIVTRFLYQCHITWQLVFQQLSFLPTLTSQTSLLSCTHLMTPIRTDGQFLGSCGSPSSCAGCQPLYCLWVEFVKLQVHVLERLYWYSWHCRLWLVVNATGSICC